jgi:hypothetical protein
VVLSRLPKTAVNFSESKPNASKSILERAGDLDFLNFTIRLLFSDTTSDLFSINSAFRGTFINNKVITRVKETKGLINDRKFFISKREASNLVNRRLLFKKYG